MTPVDLIASAVECGRVIDNRFPGLREENSDAWMAKVCWLAYSRNSRFGRKSRGPGARVSPDTVGIKRNAESGASDPFYAVSIIRDNPPTNEWRQEPLDHGLISGQLWVEPSMVDIGGGPVISPPQNEVEVRLNNLETWARNIGFKG